MATCDNCSGPLPQDHKRFCSQRCRSYWWYLANEADPAKRARQRERQQAYRARNGVRVGTTVKTCPQCEATFTAPAAHVYCSRDCRLAERNRRRRGAASSAAPEIVLVGVAHRFGAYAPKPKSIKCRVTVGVMAECPNCDSVMAALDSHRRICQTCATEVVLNPEEVDAVNAGLITA